MNRIYKKIVLTGILAIALSACNRDEIFEREQYKYVIALLSDAGSGFNIFAEEHDPATGDAEGYTDGHIAASCGGSLPTTETVKLNIVEDANLLWQYNNNSFATEAYKYARYLPADRYIIENPVITIPQGERNGRMKIRLRAGGLSPDSVYLIPFRVNQCSAYELNPNKNTVLYRVYLKNFWTSTKSMPVYSHRGIKLDLGSADNVAVNTMITKQMAPLSGNEVRMFVGDKIITQSTVDLLEKWAIRLSMDANGKVTISPWNSTRFGIKITQIDGDPEYPNVFKLVSDGYGKTYKTFLLCYEYVDSDDGITKYRMKEELRTEHIVTVK